MISTCTIPVQKPQPSLNYGDQPRDKPTFDQHNYNGNNSSSSSKKKELIEDLSMPMEDFSNNESNIMILDPIKEASPHEEGMASNGDKTENPGEDIKAKKIVKSGSTKQNTTP